MNSEPSNDEILIDQLEGFRTTPFERKNTTSDGDYALALDMVSSASMLVITGIILALERHSAYTKKEQSIIRRGCVDLLWIFSDPEFIRYCGILNIEPEYLVRKIKERLIDSIEANIKISDTQKNIEYIHVCFRQFSYDDEVTPSSKYNLIEDLVHQLDIRTKGYSDAAGEKRKTRKKN